MELKDAMREMEDFSSIVGFQEGISQRFKEDFKNHYSLFTSLSDIYLVTVKRLKERLDSPDIKGREGVTFLLMARIFNHSLSALVLLERGMIIDAAGIIRQVLETQWLLEYFYAYPEKIEKWTRGKKITPGEVRRKLKLDNERALLYDEYCRMTHNSMESTQYFSDIQEDNQSIVFGGYYMPLYIEQLFCELIVYLTNTLFVVNYEYREELKELKGVNFKLNEMLKTIMGRLLELNSQL